MGLSDHLRAAPRFLLVGVIAVLIDAVVYALLSDTLEPGGAKACSYVAGALFGYVANWKFTFGERRSSWAEVAFVATYAISLGLNVGVNALILAVVPAPLGLPLAFLAATGVSTVWNFAGLSKVVFRRSARRLDHTA